MDRVMMSYYKTEKIKETLREAERLGVNTLIARTDNHVLRFLLEFRDEGGSLQWFAQTRPEVGPQPMCVDAAYPQLPHPGGACAGNPSRRAAYRGKLRGLCLFRSGERDRLVQGDAYRPRQK